MTEEQCTIILLEFLEEHNWDILCFDFPQSGTGKVLHPANSSSKTEGSIIPDIVAVKKGVCLYFENKDHYFLPDFEKVNMLRTTTDYHKAINELTKGKGVQKVYYGIGFPTSCSPRVNNEDKEKVDFIVTVDNDKTVDVFYDTFGLVF
jgi:hypothetical protein